MKKILCAACLLVSIKITLAQKQKKESFLALQNIDRTVKPQDNFYMHVNGGWIKKTPIPASESGIGAFLDVYNKSKDNLKKIFEDLKKIKLQPNTNEQKVADFFTSGMDTIAIERLGFEPLMPYLKKIDAINNRNEIINYVAFAKTQLSSVLFSNYIGADEKNSAMNIPSFYQGGIGLPDRDYYFNNDDNTIKVVEAYKNFLKTCYILIGNSKEDANEFTSVVFDIEKAIADKHLTNVELRDPQANYNKFSVDDLNERMPNLHWKELLGQLKINVEALNIGQPKHFQNLNEMLNQISLKNWKMYLKANLFNEYANALSSSFVNARFEYTKTLTGAKELKPRWERMITSTDNNLSDALGQLYVKKYFNESSKKRMMSLIDNLQKAFDIRMSKLDWMSDETKQKAKSKLYTFLKKIGYPDAWKDYSSVKIDRNNYFQNLIECSEYEYQYQVNKVGKPVDRNEWGMTPSTVNAYYNPTFNEIVFPAGILQFPFFDPNADDAINYGGIGMVIGHEMTHGFDDQGAQYDKDGNMFNWWTKEDEIKFKAKGEAVVNLYNGLTILDTFHVKGALTLGENIADIGGIAIAYEAFKMTEQGKSNIKIDGYTPDQRFFMSYAQIWKSKMKKETSIQRINTDPHSPPIHRVNAPLMNFEPFYKAFNVKQGDKMYVKPEQRITIW